ncbi:hypothetical protein J7T55_006581 [Diaporthe amygdali]|uniref:uncharacterized protein n=1 Tax=Phomopsis amygdali TaxID=1214568 RepID=UPI0022FE75EC|nr:uncharacterized protein J7T55_006581 [Diaporthe amygdali]KAJ0125236.1 hypothetical protein J7T55_006581 [Diaporthe amygdali]
MLPTIISTKYGRYKTNQDDLATFLAVTGALCGAPNTLIKPDDASSDDAKSNRPKGKDRKLAKQRAAGSIIDESTRQKAPKLALNSYVPLAKIIAKSTSVHGRIPKWIITVIDKIIRDREECFRHINGEDVAAFLAKGQQDGHVHPINVLQCVRSILLPKYQYQVASSQNNDHPKTLSKKVLGETSGNANTRHTANMFASLGIKSPESSPSSGSDDHDQIRAIEAEDIEKADAWRTSLAPSQVFAAYPEASREEALLALGSLRGDMMLIRQAVLEQWVKFKDGAVDPAAAAITTNTAIDLVRSLEKQARPVIESYTKSLNSKDTQLPVYWYSLGSWIKDIDDKTCGTNIYAPLLGADIDCQANQSADFNSRDNTCVEGEYMGDWILESRSFRWAYMLIQLYCMEFFSKTNATFKVPPGHEPIRSGSGGRPDDAKLFEQIRTCHGQDIQWLYELSFLANYGFGPVFPCLDEVSRGFRIMHEDVDLKLWAVFGVQVFCEINEVLGQAAQPQPLQYLNNFVHGSLDFFQKAQDLYTSVLVVNSGEEVGGKSDEPVKEAQRGHTVISCLLPERLDEEIERMGHKSYPNLNKSYLMSQHPVLCGILLHTARLMVQKYGITVETCTRSIMKMAHFYNACSTFDPIKTSWFDLDHCMTALQGPNIFMSGKPPKKDTRNDFGKAFLFAVGAMSLTYAAPDCRDKMGRRGRNFTDDQFKSRKNSQGKTLQKLGPVSLMFEDRLCRAGDRYELNEEDLQAITERAAAYKGSEDEKYRMRAISKTSRSIVEKPKSVAQLLSDLSLGLDQEVLPISFPYICLNIECTKVIWKLEINLRSTHYKILHGEHMPPGFGTIALHLLAGHSDKLWIAADEIHNYVRDKTPGSTNGCTAVKWVVGNIREPLRSSLEKKICERMQEAAGSSKHTTIGFGPVMNYTIPEKPQNDC